MTQTSGIFAFLLATAALLAPSAFFATPSAQGAEGETFAEVFRREFATPPAGYGEVPFWWWTGEALDVERLLAQAEELSRKGVSGVQVNYAHQDVRNATQPNWLTFPNEPEVLTDAWFDAFEKVAARCRELKMGIGLSGYTLDWQRSPGNLFDRIIYSDPETQSRTIRVAGSVRLESGERYASAAEKQPGFFDPGDENDEAIQYVFYPIESDGRLATERFVALGSDSVALARSEACAETSGELKAYRARREPQTLNPLHPECGRRVVERFLAPFESRALAALAEGEDDGGDLGLNYFFQDELQLGTGALVWNDDVPREFESRKGYSYWEALPAMFGASGDRAEKYRLDYMDVRVRLAEERYFKPIYDWHASRGRIYGCDPGSRGKNPSEFCDYFSAIRWYTAPGHDTPGDKADFIKNKVSSSIAHFYNRPRVWLEGYHSMGWGATPSKLLAATNENYLYGANLFNLHGLYYSTYGGYWEWAPPCYHFRQPYWETFGAFLKRFERLSYALTRGTEQADFVVLYPVSSFQSGLDGNRATSVAFAAAKRIFDSGRDVLFIDDDSIARSEVRDGKLCVAGGAHGVLVLPSTQGIRWTTLQKALELKRAGGKVIALDAFPIASDRAGRNDAELDAAVAELFGAPPERLARQGTSYSVLSKTGGSGALITPRAFEKEGGSGEISKIRNYPGGFSGRWVWSSQPEKRVYFKLIVSGLSTDPVECSARFFCDNSGALFVNGAEICRGADYSNGWQGKLTLKDGDVVTIDGEDEDAPRRGSAGMFFSLVRNGRVFATSEDFRCATTDPTDGGEAASTTAWRARSKGWSDLAKVDVGNVHVLHRTGVNTELPGVRSGDDETMWNRFDAWISGCDRDVFDADTNAPCRAMRRTTDSGVLFFATGGKKNARLSFRATGRAEYFDPTTGLSRELATERVGDRTIARWPCEASETGLVVFWENEEPTQSLSDGAAERRVLSRVALDGEWDFELIPTLDNRWGDFRLPVAERFLGAEAQRFDASIDGREFERSRLNDFGPKYLVLGPFPSDADLSELESRLASAESFASGDEIEFGGKRYAWRGCAFSWRWGIEGNPGREGYHGLKERIDSRFIGLGKETEGFNERVFTAEDGGEVYYVWTRVGARVAERSTDEPIDVYASGGAPTTAWLGGAKLDFSSGELSLTRTDDAPTPVLARYDGAGRRALVFVASADASRGSRFIAAEGADSGAYNGLSTGLREERPDFVREPRTPLSTIWFDVPGVLDYTLEAGRETETRLRFVAPPGASGLDVPTYGRLTSIKANGAEVGGLTSTTVVPGAAFWRGEREGAAEQGAAVEGAAVEGAAVEGAAARPSDRAVMMTRARFDRPFERATELELTFATPSGASGAGACPEPIRILTGKGKTTLGDWNVIGVLANYSGGARYSKRFDWRPKGGRAILDLGAVGASCRVKVNGQLAGDVPTPPWKIDVTEFLVPDKENLVEIEVYNTLANFYRNIPTRYGGVVPSGLIGPVEIREEE